MADLSRDAVPLTDLEVVQRYSLAVRAATAPRAELVAALESDLAWLTGSAPRRRTASVAAAPRRSAPSTARRAAAPAEPSAAPAPARPRKRPAAGA
jgi:hypothetical protein